MKNRKFKYTPVSLGLTGLAVLLAGNMQASPLANEPFDEYPNGTTLTSTGNWTAFSSAGTLPLTVNNGTVTATNLASGASGEDDRLTFYTSPQTNVLYYSALITVPTGTTAAAAGDYFFSGYSTASTGGGYLGRVSLDLDSTTNNLAFGLSNGSTGTANIALGADLTLGSEYRLVLMVNPTTHTSSFNYQLATATPFADTSSFIAGGGAVGTVAGLDSVAIRQGSAAGDAFTTVIDGVQVGTTLGDVSGITTGPSAFFNAVPEPSTYATFAAGILALFGVQRLRRRNA